MERQRVFWRMRRHAGEVYRGAWAGVEGVGGLGRYRWVSGSEAVWMAGLCRG